MAAGSVQEAAVVLRKAKRVFALTGAGVSAESGVPTFRGDGGLWRQYRAEELATPEAFKHDPQLVWEWYAWRQGVVGGCSPNAGHDALARMQDMFGQFFLVTQNVDGLHQRAGSRDVVEMHGNIWKARCASENTAGCGAALRAHPELDNVSAGSDDPEGCGWLTVVDFLADEAPLPPPCSCGGILRPHIVWFGEALDSAVLNRAFQEAKRADVLLSIGTSAQVTPAALLPQIAAQTGAVVIEINPQATPNSSISNYALRGPSAEILPRLIS